jgi:hypothetical protein
MTAAPQLAGLGADHVLVGDADGPRRLVPGDRTGTWMLMAVAPGAEGAVAVFEDFTVQLGAVVVVDEHGERRRLTKSAEATSADPASLYAGRSLPEVLASAHDLLGRAVLAGGGDPDYAQVEACLPPITTLATHAFVGTRECPDKVAVGYGGRTENFDPAVLIPRATEIRAAGQVRDGLVGGWLPVLRFVYPDDRDAWSEVVVFAPPRRDGDNPRIQPVWYRVCRIVGGELTAAEYVDSYLGAPAGRGPVEPARFYADLLRLQAEWEHILADGMHIELPDRRLADQARHCLVRAALTRVGAFPKYGVADRLYGGPEHDGFPDTFNVDVLTALEWGLRDLAASYLDNYLDHFVRADGSLLYRGPETGQYGRMLATIARYYALTGDADRLLRHRAKIEAITALLLRLRAEASALGEDDPAHGMLRGWCEADSCLESDPGRYVLPYYSNSTQAVRGFADLGHAWRRIGADHDDEALAAHGEALIAASAELATDIQRSLERTGAAAGVPAVIAGVAEPFDVAVARDQHDPQFRAYRAYAEMCWSGCLTEPQLARIVRYRERHRDTVIGIPTAYPYTTEPDQRYAPQQTGGFLSHGHGFALLQLDRVREYLLELYALSAHQYTRGTWTAPETRSLHPGQPAAPYCVPAQLSVPLLLRWLLIFEEPGEDTLWLCRAAPRDWFAPGRRVSVREAPTRWGPIGFAIESQADGERLDVALHVDPMRRPQCIALRLRLPAGRRITGAISQGAARVRSEPDGETLRIFEVSDTPLHLTIATTPATGAASRGRKLDPPHSGLPR